MWMTIVILGAVFAAMVAILALGYQAVEQDREQQGTALLATAPAAKPGHCMLCEAPLRRPSTTDQVVFEVEHRIHAELQDISHLLRTAPESVGRLYQAQA
jgi:hypothetical protein